MKRKLSVIVLALAMALSMIPGVAAAGTGVDIDNDKGSITVKPTYNSTVVSELEVTLYKVGTPRVENNNLYFDLVAELAESPVNLNEGTITAEQVKDLVTRINALAPEVKETLVAGKGTTTEEGVKFENLDVAVYLVVKNPGGRYNFASVLLYLPYTSEDGTEWVFDVEACPKTSYTPPREDPDPLPPPTVIDPEDPPKDPGKPGEEIEDPEVPLGGLPQTGLLQWPIPMMAMAGVLMFSAGFMTDRKARKSED